MEEENRVKASPAIRRIAKQYNIDLSEIVGTGEGGRIEAENLESYLLSKRHMSFAEMSDTEKSDEYASYMDEDILPKTETKPNYDEEDYGLSFIGDDIEVEIFPAEETENKESSVFTKEDEASINHDFAKLFAFDESEELPETDEEVVEEETQPSENEQEPDSEEEENEEEISVEEVSEEPDECEEDHDECECGCGCEDNDEDDEEHECCDDDCCCHDHEHHHEEEKCQPIAISFTVNREGVADLIEETKGDKNELLINTVVKALALAIYDEDNEFDGKINVVTMQRDDIEVKTAVNALYAHIDGISYEEPFDHEDVFVNVWDLTDFGFTKFARPDAGMVNVFVNQNKRKIIIDSVSDEYCVCIDTCAFMMKSLKENLCEPFVMNERIITNEENDDAFDDDYDEDYDE